MDNEGDGKHLVSLKPQIIIDNYRGVIFSTSFKFSSPDVCPI
jgi:hypothetical protein